MAGGDGVKQRMNSLAQERSRQSRLMSLRRDTLKKIEFVHKKALIEHHDVYQLIRDFFKEFLEKHYEFTVTELRTELKHIYISNATRIMITQLLDQLEMIEYTTVHYTKEDLTKILDTFKEIVTQLVRTHTSSKSVFDRITGAFSKTPDPQTIISELPLVEGTDAYHVRIYTLIEKCYVALDQHKMHRAKATYDALLAEYDLLSDEIKPQYFHVIQQTYHDLLHRSEMQKK